MTAEEIYQLAAVLEAEDLLGDGDRPLTADDIFPVLEALEELGVDLHPSPDLSS